MNKELTHVESGTQTVEITVDLKTAFEDAYYALDNIEIREPLRSLLRPNLNFVQGHPTGNGPALSIKIDTFDRNDGRRLYQLETRFPVPHNEAYWLDRFARDHICLAKFVHRCLLSVLEHELNESIWCDEIRQFEPAHWGPT